MMPKKKFVATEVLVFDFELFIGGGGTTGYVSGNTGSESYLLSPGFISH